MWQKMRIFGKQYQDLLLELLRIPTVSPFAMEVWDPDLAKHRDALDAIVEFTKDSELQPEYYKVPPESYYREIKFRGRTIEAPLMVAEMYKKYPEILDAQPNLVLRVGEEHDIEHTICFNCHIDTVRPFLESGFEDGVFYGRGAVDMKGPLTSTLAGILYAIEQDPSLLNDISIRLQVVSGEEAGPMGIIGTAVVVKEGLTGALNIVCEPTNLGYFDSAASAMTPMIVTRGPDAHDGSPHNGFVGMHILGYINTYLEKKHIPYVLENGGTHCPAGMQTEGPSHNQVYGKTFVKYNILCPSDDLVKPFKAMFESEVRSAIEAYKQAYTGHPLYGTTAALVDQFIDDLPVMEIIWLKSGFPVLTSTNSKIQREVLKDIPRASEKGVDNYCCDVIWFDPPAIVLGPGDLSKNDAHGPREHMHLRGLEAHAQLVPNMIYGFKDYVIRRN